MPRGEGCQSGYVAQSRAQRAEKNFDWATDLDYGERGEWHFDQLLSDLSEMSDEDITVVDCGAFESGEPIEIEFSCGGELNEQFGSFARYLGAEPAGPLDPSSPAMWIFKSGDGMVIVPRKALAAKLKAIGKEERERHKSGSRAPSRIRWGKKENGYRHRILLSPEDLMVGGESPESLDKWFARCERDLKVSSKSSRAERSKWDLRIDKESEDAPEPVSGLLRPGATFEVKADRQAFTHRNAFIEFGRYGQRPSSSFDQGDFTKASGVESSGLAATKSDYWVTVCGSVCHVVPTDTLRRLSRVVMREEAKRDRAIHVKWNQGDNGATHGIALPIRRLLTYVPQAKRAQSEAA